MRRPFLSSVLFAHFLVLAAASGSAAELDDLDKAKWVALGQDAVRELLRDPASAQFRNTFFHSRAPKVVAICGEVNAKNGFGGYSGGSISFLRAALT
jgi:hypothetical protein